VLTEAVKRAGSLDREKVRDAILKLDVNTVYGRFKVDGDGYQIGKKLVTIQWQDGKKVIVWPEELAPVKARFPTPPWNQRP
jgi:branched-chain amino acid transport system substrate-binding protein